MSLVPTHPLERVELYCSSVGLKGGCWCYTTPHTKAKPGLQLSKRGEIKSSSKEELTKTWPNELPNRCILYAIIRSFWYDGAISFGFLPRKLLLTSEYPNPLNKRRVPNFPS
ncbi:hypothetical protein V6N13_057140 [Hibiscus sabdariffa]